MAGGSPIFARPMTGGGALCHAVSRAMIQKLISVKVE
jgi:hypothetical protein